MKTATLEQAFEWISEYMNSKGIPFYKDYKWQCYWILGDKQYEFNKEYIQLNRQPIDVDDDIWRIPILESKEDFLTLMSILDK